MFLPFAFSLYLYLKTLPVFHLPLFKRRQPESEKVNKIRLSERQHATCQLDLPCHERSVLTAEKQTNKKAKTKKQA